MSSSAHIDTSGYKRVGRRLANIALALNYTVKEIKTGPVLSHVVVDPCKPDTIRIVFDNVNGKLIAKPRVLGFSLRSEDGTQMTNQILSAKLDPQNPGTIIITTLTPLKENAYLWYGWGWDPVCNVIDELDMALPAFGPIKIE
jgi:sialate O-acetylesterase